MKKQTFKVINESQNIFEIGGIKIQLINDKPYQFSDSFKPNIYEYEFVNDNGEVIKVYRGKSFCGCSGRFCDHATHKQQSIDKMLIEAKDCGYLVKIRCLDVCGSMVEMDAMEERRIHEMVRDIYNQITGEETDYISYSEAKDIIGDKILNETLL